MIACEHVLGGRAFDARSRVNAARANLHLFGVVEGEDDMIRMGMVRDVTSLFVKRYLAGLLGVLRAANVDRAGRELSGADRLLRIGRERCSGSPARCAAAFGRLALRGRILAARGLGSAQRSARTAAAAVASRARIVVRRAIGGCRSASAAMLASRSASSRGCAGST